MRSVLNAVSLLLLLVLAACSAPVKTDNSATTVTSGNESSISAETPAPAAAQTQTATPEALVAELYKQHDAKKSPFFQTKDRGLVDKYFTKTLADLIWKDANASKGEVGAIDGDPLYNAQDIEIKNFSVGKSDVNGDSATVPVSFSNFNEKQTLNFLLKRSGGAWKIDNISYGGADSLLKWLKDTYAEPKKTTSDDAGNGEFEGRYQVGNTTCTVTPARMSFDVRWAKGSGVETFFYKDGNTFESTPDKGGTNEFIFDDNNYNSGTFKRADGKTMSVKRLN